MTKNATLLAAIVSLAPAALAAQAPPALISVYVEYSTVKNTVKPQGAVRATLDSLERLYAAASRTGRTGEARHLLAEALTIVNGHEWTDSADFAASLRLRSDGQIVESQRPYTVRLQQYYAARTLPSSPAVRAVIHKRGTGAQTADVAKAFPTFENVSRDLLDAPLTMQFDFHDVPDGNYTLVIDVLDSARTIARQQMQLMLRRGIADHVAQLAAAAATAPAALKAELAFPADRLRLVNEGTLPLTTFNPDADLAAADSIAAAIKAGRDHFAGKTGDFRRHYVLTQANEVMQYRVYVPTTYNAQKPAPLVIALHGLGATESSFFTSYGAKLPPLAESHGFIVAAPLGFRPDGFYGSTIGSRPSDRADVRKVQLSEADVLGVLAEMKKNYNIDPSRIYLMGHSMGAIGTWAIAAKYPDTWAALGVFSGVADTASATRIRSIPEFVVHGDADATVNVSGSRNMVAALKAAHADVTYTEVPGGSHMSVVEPNLAALFDFFSQRAKPAK
ncbi:MAG TPA: PHB depolymerase family esterase [Gemmatimonadaceae bacterium]|nr:PHB depolymerase family esterase [Gemmatimonadaceae bacterium]